MKKLIFALAVAGLSSTSALAAPKTPAPLTFVASPECVGKGLLDTPCWKVCDAINLEPIDLKERDALYNRNVRAAQCLAELHLPRVEFPPEVAALPWKKHSHYTDNGALTPLLTLEQSRHWSSLQSSMDSYSRIFFLSDVKVKPKTIGEFNELHYAKARERFVKENMGDSCQPKSGDWRLDASLCNLERSLDELERVSR